MIRACSIFCMLILACVTGCSVQYRPMQSFTSKEGNFTCLFPGGEPTWRMKGWSFPPIHVAEGINPGIEYAAGYGDAVYVARTSDLPKIYADMKDKVAADFKATILTSGEIWIDGYKGIEFVMKLPAGDERLCKMRAMLVGKRAYMLGVVAEKADLNAADVHKFFSSFRLIEKPPPVFEPSGVARR